jgi:hypothetical protein
VLDAMAQRYSTRPSSFLGLDFDPWLAYQVDRYVAENASQENAPATGARPSSRPTRFSDDPAEYVDARMYAERKVKVKEDGTWD